VTRLALASALALLLCHCGGGTNPMTGGASGAGGTLTATDPNMVAVVVDPGPAGADYTNGLFATVTLCEPGSSTNCQTFDHLLVDTGSVGVRVLESELQLSLPPVTTAAGEAVAECTPFVDGTAWGPVRRADVVISGESASNLPVQVIGEKTFLMPTSCTGSPITDFQTLSANGILGVGLFAQDCGSSCALPVAAQSGPPYYSCKAASACSEAAVPIVDQVTHPVAAFPVDNNGTIIQLPSIAASGSPSVPGVMIFGIGTQANNDLGSATVLDLDTRGFLGTTFPISGSTTYTAYLDSGSNGLFFLNAGTTKLTQCTGGLSSFYCPTSTANLAATIVGIGGVRTTVAFSVANASRLSANAYAFANLAGPMPGFPTDNTVPGFDWGLPFYFGRSVFTAIEGKATPGGPGPFFAF
jgi:hypothetical protein